MSSKKTVYVLGAGFSMNAGAPSQANIVSEIFKLIDSQNKPTKKVRAWVSLFDDFLKNTLFVTDVEKKWYPLEDVFTPMDKSISENISFRQHTPNALVELRDKFNRLVILAVRNAIDKNNKTLDSLTKFASHLIALSKKRLENEKEDSVSVITTNWDIMLDNKIHSLINKEPLPKKQSFSGVVDYCCYISSLESNDDKIKPGLYAIGKGGYNVKILKLHGSLNWMQCPKCQRLYVKFYERWNGGYVFDKKYCRHCEKNFRIKKDNSNLLITNLILPTFLKNLSNVQNKLIWQNAGIELSEASKIVFLGYSLPHADFEFKQLLSRMVRSDAEIEVVLVDSDNPDSFTDQSAKYQTAGHRYKNFFSGRNIEFNYNGVEDYLSNVCT